MTIDRARIICTWSSSGCCRVLSGHGPLITLLMFRRTDVGAYNSCLCVGYNCNATATHVQLRASNGSKACERSGKRSGSRAVSGHRTFQSPENAWAERGVGQRGCRAGGETGVDRPLQVCSNHT